MKNHEKMFCSIATLVPALLFAESHPLEDTETVLVPGTVEIVANFSGTNPPPQRPCVIESIHAAIQHA